MEQIGVSHAFGAMHLGPVVHAARLGPARLVEEEAAALELEDQQRVVLAPGLVAVHLGRELGVDRDDRRPVHHPAGEGDAVAAHVREHTAAGAIDIPEVGRVRAVMLLRLLDEGRAAKRAGIEQRLHTHVLGREAHLLGIHEEHAGILAGRHHAVGLGHAQAHRLLQHDVLAGGGAVQHQRAVGVVGRADDHHVDVVALEQRAMVGAVVRETVSPGEGLGMARRRRRDPDQSRMGVARERAGMDPAHELRTQEPDTNRFRHGRPRFSKGLLGVWRPGALA